MRSSDSDPSIGLQIHTSQVALLYSHGLHSLVFSVLNGSILAFLQRSVISNQVLLTWFAILLLVTLARTILLYSYRKKQSSDLSIAYWYWTYLAGTALSGCVWGSAAIYLFPNDQPGHQLFVVFVLAGMTAGAMSVLSASMLAFLLFVLPTSLPLIMQIFWQSTALSTPMAMMILFYLLGLSLSARGMNRSIVTSLRLRFDNSALVKEINQRQSAEEALYLEKERLQITFSAMADGVIITTAEGSIEYLNPAAENMSGWLNSKARGKKVGEVFSHVDEVTGKYMQAAIYECLKKTARSKKNSLLLTRSGAKKIIEEVATPLQDRTGNVIGAVAILRDVTQASEHSRQLAYQASHDGLTGLPNRTLLCDRLEHAISKAIRANLQVAVLYMDLDNFKQINDSLGHAAGDLVLCNVAERLRACVRQQDTVARLGGDEFVVVLEDLLYQDQANVVAQKIVDNLVIPSTIENQDISVKASIGVTVSPRDGTNVETLLKNADTAMFRTKQLAQDNIQFYTREMSTQATHRLKLEQRLQHAVERNELELFYQPRVKMNSSEIAGIEALVRWKTAPDTLLLPAEFIHIAEETGSILKIGEWVLRTACEQAQLWYKNGLRNLSIAVNLSVRQIQSTNIVELVAKVLKETGLDPQLLELEITETLFLKDAEHAIMVLRNLKALGIKLAIDDFGSGYSSLNYIKQFPIDILKIDRSFICDISQEPTDGVIVPAIIAMGHGLNLEVVAEGVESEIQRNYLSTLGCDGFQGFYFSKPLSAQAVTNLLYENNLSPLV